MTAREVERVLQDGELGPAAKLCYWRLYELKREADAHQAERGKAPADSLSLTKIQIANLLGKGDARTVDTWLDALEAADLVSVSPGNRRGVYCITVFAPFPGRRGERPDPQLHLPLCFGEEPGVSAQKPPQEPPQEPPFPDTISRAGGRAPDRIKSLEFDQSTSSEGIESELLEKVQRVKTGLDYEVALHRHRDAIRDLQQVWTVGNGFSPQSDADRLLAARLAWLVGSDALPQPFLVECIGRTRHSLANRKGKPGACLYQVVSNGLFGNPGDDPEQAKVNRDRLTALLRQVRVPRPVLPKRREAKA